ncbi:MAG: lecithin retinol acyltransferase family protein [Fibrobacter sp.]|nr:lecithin retinol acyltransferase family protein [Fibrobacter sp.]
MLLSKLAKITVLGTVGALSMALPEKYIRKFARKIRHTSKRRLQYGDVIFCERVLGAYRHFGIYTGENGVIHFAPENGDMGSDAVIHETTLKRFADGDSVYVMYFPFCIQLQTPENTVKRARSMLGCRGIKDDGYNLFLNNCEHFAIWCKTNVAESKQVEQFFHWFFTELTDFVEEVEIP